MINKKTKPITDLKDGLKKIDPKTIKHGITRVREAYALLEDYLQQTNAEK
ncbi:MAG: hypothetical protein KDD56_09545 [Bdellovibrionales bacterium]|nr:hypothetical protein [Bdellovibrionales bacterium]